MLEGCLDNVIELFFKNVSNLFQGFFSHVFKALSEMSVRQRKNYNENSEVCLGPFQHFVFSWAPFYGRFSNRDSADDGALRTDGALMP